MADSVGNAAARASSRSSARREVLAAVLAALRVPLSGVTSFTLHFLLIAFLALAIVFAPRLGLMSKENPVSVV